MLQIVIVLFCAVLLVPMQAQTAATEKKRPTVATPNVFTFDDEPPGKMPGGWGGGPANTISVDDSVAHSGKNSVRMVRDSESAGSFSTISRKIPLTYSGESLELRGFLRTETVSGFAGLWMREDQDGAPVALDNMQDRGLKDTTGWIEYSIKLPLGPGAHKFCTSAYSFQEQERCGLMTCSCWWMENLFPKHRGENTWRLLWTATISSITGRG